MSKTLSFYNLTGGLNTVQDLATINSTPNRTESPDMMNIEYYKLGGIQTMKGNKVFGDTDAINSNLIPSDARDIVCGVEYVTGNNSYMIVVNRNGDIFRYNKSTKKFVKAATSFSEKYVDPEAEPLVRDFDFYKNIKIYGVPYNNGIVFVNGNEALYYKYDGTTETVDVWTPKLSITDENNQTVETTFYPTCVASYRGRLFFGADKTEQEGGTYEGGMLFYSGIGLGCEHTWEESANLGEDAGAFAEFFEDSSNFTGLGVWAEFLVIHKEQNTYLLDGTGDLASEWELKPYSEYTVPSQHSYVIANNGYFSYIPEANGIYPLLSRNIYNNTFQGGDLAYKIKDSFEYLDNLHYDNIFAVHHPKKKYIMFYMPTLNGTGSNYCYIYDIQTKTWLLRRVPQEVTSAFKFNNETFIGIKDTDGTVKVLKEFTGKSFDGKPIDFYYLTPPFIWGGGTNKTTTKEFRVKLVNNRANHFYIESFKDGLILSKEKRLVKNVNDNLDGLIWDIGLNKDDKLYDDSYIDAGDFYEYTYDGETYYTKELITSENNPILFSSATVPDGYSNKYVLSEPLGYYLYYKTQIKTSTTQQYADETKQISHQTYAWNQQQTTSYCYKNGNYLAWVDQRTGQCTCNYHSETQYVTSGYAYVAQITQGAYGANYSIGFRVGNPSWLSDGAEHLCYSTQVAANLDQVSPIYGWFENGAKVYLGSVAGYMVYNSPSQVVYYTYTIPTQLYRKEEWDSKSETTVYVVDSDRHQRGTKTIGAASITLDGMTFSRYSAGDEGSATSDINYYTRVKTNGSTTVYSDSSTSTSLSSGTISGDTLSYNSLTLVRYPQADGVRYTYEYYKYMDLVNETPTTIDGLTLIYEYPDDDDPIWEQTLTDTIWDYSGVQLPYIISRTGLTDQQVIEGIREGYTYEDKSHTDTGDAWLQPGYQTKRMLLPNQYFETVQFKFSSSESATTSDSICISGFEVDGIQLAETPWR